MKEEERQTEDLGERLDRVSRQVANLAGGSGIPVDLDRRLDQLAQGLESVAERVERLTVSSHVPGVAGSPSSGRIDPLAEEPTPELPLAVQVRTPGFDTAEPEADQAQTGIRSVGKSPGGWRRRQIPVSVGNGVGQEDQQVVWASSSPEFRGLVQTVDSVPVLAAGVSAAEVLVDGSDSISHSDDPGQASAEPSNIALSSAVRRPDSAQVGLEPLDTGFGDGDQGGLAVVEETEGGDEKRDGAASEGPAGDDVPQPLLRAASDGPPEKAWVVNLIAVRKESTALGLQRTFREKGVVCEVFQLPAGLFSVRVGGFSSRAEASAAVAVIGGKLGIDDAYVSLQ
jgi:hypothetical protein